MTLDVDSFLVQDRWMRHVPAAIDPTARPTPPPDNRWQHGSVVDALYFAESEACMWAEWYRHLAERGLPPATGLPRDVWHYEIEPLTVANLTDDERLGRVGLHPPTPGRTTWPPFQAIGEQLHAEGWAGLLAPSAARPTSLILCLFLSAGAPPPQLRRLRSERVDDVPPPPTGMRT